MNDLSPTQIIMRQAAEHMARSLDDHIKAAIDQRLGAGAWKPEDLQGRMEVHTHQGDPNEYFLLDGRLLLKAGPIHTKYEGQRVNLKQNIWSATP